MLNRRRGSYLLLALFFTIVAGTAALILLELLPSEASSLRVARRDVEATQAADAGVRDCMAWISFQLKNNIEPLSTPTLARSGTIGSWNWQALISADSQTPPNPQVGIRMYKVESTARWDSIPKRKIVCWLQAGTSFSKYAAFTHVTPPPGWTSFILRDNQTAVDGSFRTNGVLKLDIPPAYFGSAFPANRSFLGMVTASGSSGSGDGITYLNASPSSASNYDRMNSLGKPGFQIGVSPMAVPAGPQPFANAAWGGTAPPTPPVGVTVNPAGGIFVDGVVDSLALSLDAGGNSVYTITQGATVTKVTRVSDTPVGLAPVGTRLVQVGASQSVVPGLGTGVFYATGDVAAVNGTVKGDNTIATDFSSGKDIEITGNLLRDDTTPGAKPTSTRDNLGLIGDQVRITDNTSVVPRSSSTTLRLYAAMYARDRFLAEQAANVALGVGRLEVFGSIISTNNWITQTYNSVTFVPLSGFSHPSGTGTFRLVTDPNSGFFPPPFFPASSNGQIEIRYWREFAL
ncbi:hypothetical protein IV102_33155 [bacterium]|nr:hypothetical protein [bacterium]